VALSRKGTSKWQPINDPLTQTASSSIPFRLPGIWRAISVSNIRDLYRCQNRSSFSTHNDHVKIPDNPCAPRAQVSGKTIVGVDLRNCRLARHLLAWIKAMTALIVSTTVKNNIAVVIILRMISHLF